MLPFCPRFLDGTWESISEVAQVQHTGPDIAELKTPSPPTPQSALSSGYLLLRTLHFRWRNNTDRGTGKPGLGPRGFTLVQSFAHHLCFFNSRLKQTCCCTLPTCTDQIHVCTCSATWTTVGSDPGNTIIWALSSPLAFLEILNKTVTWLGIQELQAYSFLLCLILEMT